MHPLQVKTRWHMSSPTGRLVGKSDFWKNHSILFTPDLMRRESGSKSEWRSAWRSEWKVGSIVFNRTEPEQIRPIKWRTVQRRPFPASGGRHSFEIFFRDTFDPLFFEFYNLIRSPVGGTLLAKFMAHKQGNQRVNRACEYWEYWDVKMLGTDFFIKTILFDSLKEFDWIW